MIWQGFNEKIMDNVPEVSSVFPEMRQFKGNDRFIFNINILKEILSV